MNSPRLGPNPSQRGPVAHLSVVSTRARGAMEGGPLRADEAERALLGSILLDGVALEEARAEGVQREDFYKEDHREVFGACEATAGAGLALDTVTVFQRLLTGGGEPTKWVKLLHELATTTPTAANAAHYASIVVEAATRRRLRAALADAGAALDEGVMTAVEAARLVSEVSYRVEAGGVDKGKTSLETTTAQMNALERGEAGPSRFSSGIPELDVLLDGGPYAGQLALVLGSSGGGKTTLLRHLALQAARAAWPVSYYSAEEGPDATSAQMTALLGRYSLGLLHRTQAGRLRAGEEPVAMAAVVRALGELKRLPLRFFGQRGRVDARQILAQMRASAGPQVFAVDYLQRLDLRPPRREDTRSDLLLETVRELADVAAQTGHLLLLAAQAPSGLRAAPEQSQISECPRAEQAAETVLGTWIPARQDPERDKREFEIHVLKNRYGETGRALAKFTGHCKRLDDPQGWQPRQPQPQHQPKPKGRT